VELKLLAKIMTDIQAGALSVDLGIEDLITCRTNHEDTKDTKRLLGDHWVLVVLSQCYRLISPIP
jgi:hypothetical protein